MCRLTFILLLPFLGCGQPFTEKDIAFLGKKESATSYLIKQDFEGVGYDNGELWTTNSGTLVNPDYQTVVLLGADSFRTFQAGAGSGSVLTPLFATNTEVWIYFLLRPVDIQAAGGFKALVGLRDEGGSIRWEMTVNQDGTVRLASSSVATSVGALSEGTTYHCWLHYKATVSFDFGFSTDGIRPTSGNNFVALTSGLQAGNCPRVVFGRDSGTFTCDYIFDKVRVDDVQIGDNPS